MNSNQRKTLQAVFEQPTRSDIKWDKVQALLLAIGCQVAEGSGSRISFYKDGCVATFHRPHPRPEVHKGTVKALRAFLEQIGVTP